MRKPVQHPRLSLEARFWPRVIKGSTVIAAPKTGVSTPCWLWHGAVNAYGYGKLLDGAHRVSYRMHRGEPGKLWVLHRCDVRRCVRPDHLFLGTVRENTQDMIDKDRDPRGVRHPMARLSEDQVRLIRSYPPRLRRALAESFGVGRGAVDAIMAHKTWRHVS